jgi:hypothetical protein
MKVITIGIMPQEKVRARADVRRLLTSTWLAPISFFEFSATASQAKAHARRGARRSSNASRFGTEIRGRLLKRSIRRLSSQSSACRASALM